MCTFMFMLTCQWVSKSQTSPAFKLPKSLVILSMLSLRYVVLRFDTKELSMISWRIEEVVFLEVGYMKFAYFNARNIQIHATMIIVSMLVS